MWPSKTHPAALPRPRFRVASAFDVIDRVRGPLFLPGHPLITDPEQVRALTTYLVSGEPVSKTPLLGADVVNPELSWAVPLHLRTDGRWIWCEASAYYLEKYGIAPDQNLLRDLRSGGTGRRPVDSETLGRARRFVDDDAFGCDALAAIA